MSQSNLVHWADMTADRIIKQIGDKDSYTVASGITPSGVVHFGNFREVITTDFVACALRARGKKVRFIFSWDNYDTFRKVPKNLPKQEELKAYLYRPIIETPDPFDKASSYAEHHQVNFESQLKKVGVKLEPLYQAEKYRRGDYRQQIKRTLQKKEEIKAILDQHRSTPLASDWWPLSVYCEKCRTDHQTQISDWDGEDKLSYGCSHCGHSGVLSLGETSQVKLPWRIDWPMRWAYEQVDFEPGGKDHSSQGGSYTTAKEIVGLFDWRTPVYLQYDFVSIKGRGGKMSSSSGDLVTVDDVLKIYTPEMIRWIFASYKSNVDFAVSFDLDVIKCYEDFDRQERQAWGVEASNEKKAQMAKRVMELSYIGNPPGECPFRPSFRHLTNILQIHNGDLEKTLKAYQDDLKNSTDEEFFKQRAQCALNWLELYAPEDFKFSLNSSPIKWGTLNLSSAQEGFLKRFIEILKNEWEEVKSDKDLHEKMYQAIHQFECTPQDAFPPLYQLLISRNKGPKMAGFITLLGRDKVLSLIEGK